MIMIIIIIIIIIIIATRTALVDPRNLKVKVAEYDFPNCSFVVNQFSAFKGLYIQTNVHDKFLKKLYKTMNFDLHT